MRVFDTYFYEVLKGTKPVALVTCESSFKDKIAKKLEKAGLDFIIQDVSDLKINIFFGKKDCMGVIKKFFMKPLNSLNPYEDFILGAILGYDIKLQCKRLLEKTS